MKIKFQARVVTKVDNAIYQISHHLADKVVCCVNTYPFQWIVLPSLRKTGDRIRHIRISVLDWKMFVIEAYAREYH